MFFRILQHLLPNAKAWRIIVDKKLRNFFKGLSDSDISVNVKIFYDNIYDDINPQKTRQLDLWESQFALPETGLTESERRDRLEATWKFIGGQDPTYIQATLQASGFPVYVHEWWVPSTEHPAGGSVNGDVVPVMRNPLSVLDDAVLIFYTMNDGHADSQDNDILSQDGGLLGKVGYPLVNKNFIYDSDNDEFKLEHYIISTDNTTWPYYIYIGGEIFGDVVNISQSRKDEFENLCLKICPLEQWIGILVTYN